MTYQPPDQVWLFRQEQTWSVMTLRRAETWSDAGVQAPSSGTAQLVIEEADCLDALSEMVQARYGASGWASLLDAGHDHDAELFGAWVACKIEADLDAAVFRTGWAGPPRSFAAGAPGGLRAEIEGHLLGAGFEVISLGPPPRPGAPGENFRLAQGVLARHGREMVVIVRVGGAGEIYTRLADPTDIAGPVMWERGGEVA